MKPEDQTLKNTRLAPDTTQARAFDVMQSRTLVAAQASKLREGNAAHHQRDSHSFMKSAVTQANLQQISGEQQLRIIDNENALQLMPEIEWASRVIVGSILSPKDMTKRELIYNIDIDWIPAAVRSQITEKIKTEIEKVYDYSDGLYTIIKDALFTKGAYPRLILPEAAVDRIINSGETLTMESLSSLYSDTTGTKLKTRGYLGPLDKNNSAKITMESFQRANKISRDINQDEHFVIESFKNADDYAQGRADSLEKTVLPTITITDNYDAIKLPAYLESIAAAAREALLDRPEIEIGDAGFMTDELAKDLSVNMESFHRPERKGPSSGLTEKEFRSAVYKSAPNNIVTHLRVPGRNELKRRSVGRPLVKDLPPEAVMGVHVPGNPRQKLGYIIAIDEFGHPISLANADQIMTRAQNQFNTMNSANAVGNSSMGSMVISKAARNLTGGTQVTQFQHLSQIFEQIVESNIIPRFINGAYPGGVELSDTGNLYNLMLSRTLCSMHTRLMFVPAEMLTYFAFDYHSNGMGRSLLDSNKMLIAFRAGLLLTRMNGEMRNAIPLTKVNMKIDELDPDFEKTWSETLDIVSKTRQPQFPLATLAVNDIMDWVHRSGFIFSFEGHPRMPDTKFEFEKITHNIPLPDLDSYESLGKQLYLGFGIPAEVMGARDNEEFAIAIASRNIMFTQTILEYQKTASGLITEDHHRLILSDGTMLNTIVGLVRENWGNIVSKLPKEDLQRFKENPRKFSIELVERIVTSVGVSLPSPDTTTLTNQADVLENFITFLDKALPAHISSEVVSSDLAPELSQKMETIQPMIRAALIREFMAKNNMLPELFRASAVDAEGRPAFDLFSLTEAHTTGLMANLMAAAKALVPLDSAVAKDSDKLGLTDEGGDSGSGGSGESGGGFGELGGFDELGGDEVPPEQAEAGEENKSPAEDAEKPEQL